MNTLSNKEKMGRVNEQYQRMAKAETSASLKSFLRQGPLNGWLYQRLESGPWLEVGCGAKSLFEEGDGLLNGLSTKSDLWAMDLSDVAISKAQKGGRINYRQHDLSIDIPQGPYAFILDGHFLHCLNSLPQVFATLGHILKALKPGAYYAGEVMTIHKEISFESSLFYDFDSHILFQGDIPIRVILSAREWEDLFISCGFEISYFVYQASIKMIPVHGRTEAMSGDPECLRFVLRRP